MATSNLRKAALTLAGLPSPQQRQLLDKLGPRQAAMVTAEINALGEVDAAEQEAAAREFAEARVSEHRQPSTAPFEFLLDLDHDELVGLLADEQPQTIALILSNLPPRKAAAVLDELTPEGQFAVISRIATMGEASPEVVRDVAEALWRRLHGPAAEPADKHGLTQVVRMLNVMEPAEERRLLHTLAEADPQLAQEIRRTMFGFDAPPWEERGAAKAG